VSPAEAGRTCAAMPEANITHEWTFRMRDAFPAESPLARFIVAVAQGMNDSILANDLFVRSERPYENIYLFNLVSSHLYEVAETFRQAHREWDEVRAFCRNA
jgi:hypothetical protein